MLKHWQQLQVREQRLVLLMALCILTLVLYFGAWQPLSRNAIAAEQGLSRAQETLAYVQNNGERILAARNSASSGQVDNQSPINDVLIRTSRDYSIGFARVQQRDELVVEVAIERVPFDALLSWLTRLEQQYAIRVSKADLARDKQNGFVQVRRLELSR